MTFWKFYETLTNDVISFEQPGQVVTNTDMATRIYLEQVQSVKALNFAISIQIYGF